MAMQRVAIAGASGRMGRMLVEALAAASDLRLVAALDRDDSPAIGTLATTDIVIRPDTVEALDGVDVLIDFTRPEASLRHVAACRERGVKLVVGTTGFDDAGRAAIVAAGNDIAVVFSPNMSIGVNVVFSLIEQASRALGPDYDVEIVEAHHRHKVDAPSGTAVRLGEIVATARGTDLDSAGVFAREGQVGERRGGTIGFSAIRGGDIVGDHTVLYAGDGERIEITHRASGRAGYAAGSLLAARYLATRDRGLFDMQDVLRLR